MAVRMSDMTLANVPGFVHRRLGYDHAITKGELEIFETFRIGVRRSTIIILLSLALISRFDMSLLCAKQSVAKETLPRHKERLG